MKKLMLLCVIVAGLAFTAKAQSDNKPGMKFIEEKHDFGRLTQGTPVSAVFEFINTGGAPLIISNVQRTCDCITVDYAKAPIAAGAKGTIKITYDAAKAGTFNKAIIITSNASLPTKYITIIGEVVAKVR